MEKFRKKLVYFIFGSNFSLLILAISIKLSGGFRDDEFPIIIATLIPIFTLYLGPVTSHIKNAIEVAKKEIIKEKKIIIIPYKNFIFLIFILHLLGHAILMYFAARNFLTIEQLQTLVPLNEAVFALLIGAIIPVLLKPIEN